MSSSYAILFCAMNVQVQKLIHGALYSDIVVVVIRFGTVKRLVEQHLKVFIIMYMMMLEMVDLRLLQ